MGGAEDLEEGADEAAGESEEESIVMLEAQAVEEGEVTDVGEEEEADDATRASDDEGAAAQRSRRDGGRSGGAGGNPLAAIDEIVSPRGQPRTRHGGSGAEGTSEGAAECCWENGFPRYFSRGFSKVRFSM